MQEKDIVKLSLCQLWSPLETFAKLFFFKLYLLLLCRQKLPSKFRKIYEEFEGILVRTFHFITPLYKFILTLYVEKAPFISGGSFSSQVKQLIASTVKAEYNT